MTILVIAEHDNASLKAATLNTVAAAQKIGGDIHVLVAGAGCAAVAGFGITQPDALVAGKVGVQHHVQQAALALGEYRGCACQRCRYLTGGADPAQAAGALGDQEAAIRQQGDRPGVVQAAGNGLHLHLRGACRRSVRGSPSQASCGCSAMVSARPVSVGVE